MLQKQHPDIALSIKTRQAIRSVLNSLRNGIHDLQSDGILEESDGHKLKKVYSTFSPYCHILVRGHRGCDHMVVGFITTYAISAYHH
jgi:hypothetical protein